ncbi:MAG: hypothetical protein JXA23_08585, partial [Bacteroidales bacterium]|nr:hypothetical protein [Bacteroidales bacterium]
IFREDLEHIFGKRPFEKEEENLLPLSNTIAVIPEAGQQDGSETNPPDDSKNHPPDQPPKP